MSELSAKCDEVLACTQAMLAIVQSQEPQLVELTQKFQARTALFSDIQSLASSADAELLTTLASNIRPLDTIILNWMHEHQRSLATSLRRVKQGAASKTQSAPAQILIQSA